MRGVLRSRLLEIDASHIKELPSRVIRRLSALMAGTAAVLLHRQFTAFALPRTAGCTDSSSKFCYAWCRDLSYISSLFFCILRSLFYYPTGKRPWILVTHTRHSLVSRHHLQVTPFESHHRVSILAMVVVCIRASSCLFTWKRHMGYGIRFQNMSTTDPGSDKVRGSMSTCFT